MTYVEDGYDVGVEGDSLAVDWSNMEGLVVRCRG